ncbi:hypothetical protein HUG17_7401 [Dermatophagoides farinae]|uniref:Uncharacterized protein n=1 Tax=Dermatophagoides farinae TaxID=6954 RepID=A0A9D4SDN4_DERFA|nr:hypothetical protein HUG17_7401 [Dermatophagoides farinae]
MESNTSVQNVNSKIRKQFSQRFDLYKFWYMFWTDETESLNEITVHQSINPDKLTPIYQTVAKILCSNHQSSTCDKEQFLRSIEIT